MSGRLEGKTAIVVGGGQTPGATIGNGRATSILFAREGARVLVVDRDLDSAKETKAMIDAEGGTAEVHAADVCSATDCESISDRCVELYGAIDILHNNVGIGGGDAGPTRLTEEAWDQIMDVNQNTNTIAYYLITCELFHNLHIFLDFCIDHNQDIFYLKHRSLFQKMILPLKKITRKKILKSQANYSTMRMTISHHPFFP